MAADDKDIPNKKKKQSNSEIKSTYLEEIDRLNLQICRLEEEIEAQELGCAGNFTLESLQTISSQLLSSTRGEKARKARSQEDKHIEPLKRSVEKLEGLTGMKIEENQTILLSTTDNNNNKTKTWRRKIVGLCESLEFTAEFEVVEDKKEGDITTLQQDSQEPAVLKTATIMKLTVMVKDVYAAEELSNFIQTVQQEKALQIFLQGLQRYSNWFSCRQRTFLHFKSKYPTSVLIPSGTEGSRTLQVFNSSNPGLIFVIRWTISVSDGANVVPCIDTFVCSPQSERSEEEEEIEDTIVKSVPLEFRKMLSAFGIEQAIELIIQIVLR